MLTNFKENDKKKLIKCYDENWNKYHVADFRKFWKNTA